MAVTKDLDVSMATFAQFYFQYNCIRGNETWPREHTVLFQYSTNGGISWYPLKDLYDEDLQQNRRYIFEFLKYRNENSLMNYPV